jgi:hypothetical protein
MHDENHMFQSYVYKSSNMYIYIRRIVNRLYIYVHEDE